MRRDSQESEATTMTMTTVTSPPLSGPITRADVDRWADTWNTHDIDAILTLFTPDAVVYQPQNPQPLKADGMRRFFGMNFTAFPDMHFAVEEAVIQGLSVASFELATGTLTGAFTDPSTGTVRPANGRKFALPAAMRIHYREDHLIKEVRIYWDRLVLMSQLGWV